MMNLDQIASRIADPGNFPASEISALRELTEKYPYAQVFSILYLKALALHNDIGFDEALQQHAYRITDRMKLYDLIHGSIAETTPAVPERPQITEHQTAKTEDIQAPAETRQEPDAVVETQPETAALPVADTTPVPVREAPVAEVPIPAEETQSPAAIPDDQQEEVIPAAESLSETVQHAAEDPLELEIISQVVSNVYSDNLEHSVPKKEDQPVRQEIPETAADIPATTPVSGHTSRSFTSWLKAGDQAATPKTDAPEQAPPAAEAPKRNVDSIIEQFIKEEPSISRPKKEFYSPTKKAKESLNTEGLIYTETLANIFAIQGNFPKAILAYEQLMLTNPEKKIFFAQRIKELKEKLNT